jgi:capsular exopolysaccharide synthesis family protein
VDFLRSQTTSNKVGFLFETLGKNLELMDTNDPIDKTYMLASAVPNEGKTTIVANLAIALALSGKNVLVVDGDLRRPTLGRLFEVDNYLGLADILNGESHYDDLVQTKKLETKKHSVSLSVLASGKTIHDQLRNKLPQDLLKNALDHYKKKFDVIIVDSSPILTASEALELSLLMGRVILVVNTGYTEQQLVFQAKEKLEEVGSRLLGVVMNQFTEGLHGPSLNHYYSY